MRERVVLAVCSALAGGALSGILTMANTAGRLTAVEASLQRIELRLDSLSGGRK